MEVKHSNANHNPHLLPTLPPCNCKADMGVNVKLVTDTSGRRRIASSLARKKRVFARETGPREALGDWIGSIFYEFSQGAWPRLRYLIGDGRWERTFIGSFERELKSKKAFLLVMHALCPSAWSCCCFWLSRLEEVGVGVPMCWFCAGVSTHWVLKLWAFWP